MLKKLFFSAFILVALCVNAQINPVDITIVRDSFGVPHIYGKTDADAAYGLAWAHAEDDFDNIQYNLLAGKGMLGLELGKDGVLFDYALKFLKIDQRVEDRYEQDLSPGFRKMVEAYAQGINDYAAAHPRERLIKKAFPFTAKDVIKGYVLETSLLAGLGMALKAINDDKISEFYSANDVGSNAMAIAPFRTEDSSAYLLVNSHQPIEGRFAWYEAHIKSDEGWNMIGGLFPGGLTAFVGTNEHLGWAHTTNYHNFGDIYLLEINHDNKNQYHYDGEWRDFKKRKIKLKLRLWGFLPLRVGRKVLETEYGPVFKANKKYYALRFPAYKDIREGEQWYRMNKAKNLEEFEAALQMEAVPLFNTIYADREGNILFHSGGKVPKRDPDLDWSQPIKANKSSYKWEELLDYDELPTVLNPECGFVFNCNQTPLEATGKDECEWNGSFVGLQQFIYNRGERFRDMLESHKGDFTWEDFRRIKFDKSYSDSGSYMDKLGALYNIEEAKYPDIADAIRKLKNWDLTGNVDDTTAALVMVIQDILRQECDCPFGLLMIRERKVTEEEAVNAIRKAKKFLIKKFGSLNIPLGQVQRHIRGDVSLPAGGLREVPRAADAVLYKKRKGIFRVKKGDGYIQMVKLFGDKVELKTINAYGASAKPDSPHYTDQMQMFENEQFRDMTLDWDEVMKEAVRVYHPGE